MQMHVTLLRLYLNKKLFVSHIKSYIRFRQIYHGQHVQPCSKWLNLLQTQSKTYNQQNDCKEKMMEIEKKKNSSKSGKSANSLYKTKVHQTSRGSRPCTFSLLQCV
ncbi:hypothetical protein ILYODFUR_012604 [Ilyodon furcidens]|uniref:Uncharacterized protein n=1 Tax=Ilyodon furcidens TaxID=33524 RepID=A0ABV0UU82_9TELE